jgi:hypothetical protein
MATWQVIKYTGQTLIRLLQRQFDVLMPGAGITIQLASSAQFEHFAGIDKPAITLFLYHVLKSPESVNAPARRLPDGTLSRQPLPLELYYMVTPWGVRSSDTNDVDAQATEEEHRLLGGILQTFYDHAEVSASDLSQDGATSVVWSTIDTIQIVLDTGTIEDLFRVWDSGEQPFRTSLLYRVRVVGMEPGEMLGGPPVIDAGFTAGQL